MLFSSTVFIYIFLPCVFFIYYVILHDRIMRNIFLFVASILFYAYGEPWFVLVMLASILVNYVFGLLTDYYRSNKTIIRIIILLMLICNFSILYIFKYLIFTLNIINNIFILNIPLPHITLPIGISFFTFQAVSYVLDVYRGHGEAQKNPLNVGLYIAFFPQLIAGPIVRYEDIALQIKERKENLSDAGKGIGRFIVGLAKKVLLANSFSVIADKAFELNPDNMSIMMAWLGAIAYTLQIYFDFSGYSDMAIGLGKCFGFNFLENFNFPYAAKTVTEFWRKWHISLSTWFRDYVYFPMGGSRVNKKSRLVFNLFLVWFLTGVWHGANFTFIIWGLYYFIIIVIEKFTNFENRLVRSKLSFIKNIYLLVIVIIGWVIFRSPDIGYALNYIKTMFGVNLTLATDAQALYYARENLVYFIAGIIFSVPAAGGLAKLKLRLKPAGIEGLAYVLVLLLLFIVSTSYLVKGTYNPFIYFNF